MAKFREYFRITHNLIAKLPRFVIYLVVVLVMARALLPFVVKYYINREINQSKEYSGYVRDVDLHIYRGAYEIQGMHLYKKRGKIPVPLIYAPSTDIAIFWKQLFKGKVVAKIKILEPEINFVDSESKSQKQFGAGEDWLKMVDALAPIRIDKFSVDNATIFFRKFDSSPKININVHSFYAEVTNLTNSEEFTGNRVAHGSAKGIMGEGTLNAKIALDPFSRGKSFDLDTKLVNLPIPYLNDVLREYLKVDVASGKASVYLEVAAKDKQIKGYVKPLIWDADILNWKQDVQQDGDNPLKLLWEGFAGFAAEILENQKKDQFATKIPLYGKLDDPQIGIIRTLLNVLKNGFIKAFSPKLDNDVGEGKDRDKDKKKYKNKKIN